MKKFTAKEKAAYKEAKAAENGDVFQYSLFEKGTDCRHESYIIGNIETAFDEIRSRLPEEHRILLDDSWPGDNISEAYFTDFPQKHQYYQDRMVQGVVQTVDRHIQLCVYEDGKKLNNGLKFISDDLFTG